MTDEFRKIVDDDIDLCIKTISYGDRVDWETLGQRLMSKYGNIIDGFNENLITSLDKGTQPFVVCDG